LIGMKNNVFIFSLADSLHNFSFDLKPVVEETTIADTFLISPADPYGYTIRIKSPLPGETIEITARRKTSGACGATVVADHVEGDILYYNGMSFEAGTSATGWEVGFGKFTVPFGEKMETI